MELSLANIARRSQIIDSMIFQLPAGTIKACASGEEICRVQNMMNKLLKQTLLEKTCDYVTLTEGVSIKVLESLRKRNWLRVEVKGNYASISLRLDSLFSLDELTILINRTKAEYYALPSELTHVEEDMTKTAIGRVHNISRPGFAKAGLRKVKYANKYIRKYMPEIISSILNALDNSGKNIWGHLSYADLTKLFTDMLSKKDVIFQFGENTSDSRGRSIYECTKSPVNPVSCKALRACLATVKSRPLSMEGEKAVALFVAELIGFPLHGHTWEERIARGFKAIEDNYIPAKVDLDQQIWLERIYEQWPTRATAWDVYIELDATASALQHYGAVLGSMALLNATNVVPSSDGIMHDAWTIKGCPRLLVKKCLTPQLYGSSKSAYELAMKNGIKATDRQLDIVNKAIKHGIYKAAADLKDFLIENCVPQSKMKFHCWNEVFDVWCTRKTLDEIPSIHQVLLESGEIINIQRSRNAGIDDLNQFRRFMPTGLIHNLDSQLADKLARKYEIMTNHDAFLCHPNDAHKIRADYAFLLHEEYLHREDILREYFHSIGIDKAFRIESLPEDVVFSGNCLK